MKQFIENILLTAVCMFVLLLIVYVASYSPRAKEYSKHGCMVTTGNEACQTASKESNGL